MTGDDAVTGHEGPRPPARCPHADTRALDPDLVPGERRRRLLRVSAHLHNDPGEYAQLAEALRALLAEENR